MTKSEIPNPKSQIRRQVRLAAEVKQSRNVKQDSYNGFGVWDLGFGISDLGFGIWDLELEVHHASLPPHGLPAAQAAHRASPQARLPQRRHLLRGSRDHRRFRPGLQCR